MIGALNKWSRFLDRLSLGYFLYRKTRRARRLPFEVTIEVTNHCNLRCRMCARSALKRDKGFVDLHLVSKVAEEVKDEDVLVVLSGWGEPLLHPKIGEIINILKGKGVEVVLFTNATLLNEVISRDLIKSGLDAIIFSFDGASKETYERLRVGASFDITCTNIINFIKLKRVEGKRKPYTIIQLVVSKDNLAEVNQFREKWTGIVDLVSISPFSSVSGHVNEDLSPINLKYGLIEPCPWLWISTWITWDGKVIPCCKDLNAETVLGRVGEERLTNIWNGEKYQRLRGEMAQGNYEMLPYVCQKCDQMTSRYLVSKLSLVDMARRTIRFLSSSPLHFYLKELTRLNYQTLKMLMEHRRQ